MAKCGASKLARRSSLSVDILSIVCSQIESLTTSICATTAKVVLESPRNHTNSSIHGIAIILNQLHIYCLRTDSKIFGLVAQFFGTSVKL